MQKINYTEEVEKLVALQDIDYALFDLNQEREDKPKLIEALESDFEQKKHVLKEYEDKTKDLIVKRKDKENDLASKEESIQKLQTQLYTLKTNKEYSAMITEIESAKMDKSLVEEVILNMFEEQDGLKQGLEDQKAVVKNQEGKFQQEKQELLNRIKEIEGQILELQAKRRVAGKQIDPKILSQYERILKGKGKSALAKVERHACQGCFMNTPPQVINEIRMHDKLVFCEMCARILYVDDESES